MQTDCDVSSLVSMVRQSRNQPPPRPHSADFLEYEAARRPQQQPTQCERPPDQQRRPQRPKSSLDIVNPSDTTNDGYFYSEERYGRVNSFFQETFYKLGFTRNDEKEKIKKLISKKYSLFARVQIRGADAAVRGVLASDPPTLSAAEESVPFARHDAAEAARYSRQNR